MSQKVAILCEIFILCYFQLESVKEVKCAKTNKFREVTVQDQCDRIKMYSARDNTRMDGRTIKGFVEGGWWCGLFHKYHSYHFRGIFLFAFWILLCISSQ